MGISGRMTVLAVLLLVSVHVSADAGYYGGYGGYGYGVTELAHGYVHTVYYAGYGGYGYGKRSAEADTDPGHRHRPKKHRHRLRNRHYHVYFGPGVTSSNTYLSPSVCNAIYCHGIA